MTGDPGIRFYAGVPLRSAEGHNVGTVCVLDRRPRRLSGAQRDVLRQVGRDVMAQLERHRQGRAPLVDRMLETVDRDAKPATPGEPPLAGSRFGRYTILDEIGRGAMATVYTAYDDQLDRKVAIKLIRDPDAHVHQEAQAVARISHPNVVQIYEIGRFEGQEFIAMELIDGVNLTTWQAIRSRNVYDIIAMYAQAGRGLAAAHRAGLVHRDFKPDNVLVGSNGRPRVGDFGLAHMLDPDARLATVVTLTSSDGLTTRDDAVVGTPAYMAPEQLLNGPVDGRADQFGLCAALYEGVYGGRPLRGASVEELRASARSGALQEPPAGATAPPALRALLQRGLARDPADRWPSLAALLDQLDQLDAQRDPAAAGRERRRIVFTLVAVWGAAIGSQLGRGARAPGDIGVGEMLGATTTVLVVVGLGVYRARAKLLQNHYHSRMIVVLFAAIVGNLVVPPVCVGAGISSEHILLVEMLMLGQIFLVAAPFISPRLLLNCLLPWAGAAAVACGAPVLQCFTIVSLLGVLVFALSWSYVPPVQHICSRVFGSPSTRTRD